MKRKSEAFSQAVVGLFMIVVLLLLGYFTIVISGVDVLSGRHRIPVRINFTQVGGLKARDNVMYRGTKVGVVDRVEVGETNLTVVALIDDRVVLRRNCKASVCTLSMLGGYYLKLDEGLGEPQDIRKAVIAGVPPTDWMEDVSRIARNLSDLTSRSEIETVVTNFTVMSERMREISEKAAEIMSRIDRGEGTVGRLLSADESLYTDLRTTVADAKRMMSGVSNAMASATRAFDGVAAITDDIRDEKTMADFKGGLAAFRTAAESLDAKDLMSRAGALVDNLNAVAERVKAGEGTLGRLASDAKLYDELNALVRDMRQVLDNYRDTTPISTFSSLATGAL